MKARVFNGRTIILATLCVVLAYLLLAPILFGFQLKQMSSPTSRFWLSDKFTHVSYPARWLAAKVPPYYHYNKFCIEKISDVELLGISDEARFEIQF